MTLGELLDEIRAALGPQPETVTGIQGLAQIFGVSESTAKRIKASGVLNKAISQSGRVIVTDVKLARELFSNATHGRKTKN